MEDILDLYQQLFDENYLVICMDEKLYQLLGEVRDSLSLKAGSPNCVDNEYECCGICSVFVFTGPLGGWRYVHARERCTKMGWVYEIKELLAVYYPNVSKVCLVVDNLNIHNFLSLYEVFCVVEVRELVKRFEFHYTSKYGSWLNIAEIELSVFSR